MIAAIRNLDPIVAAGVLARTALALESYDSNPQSHYVIENEERLRSSIKEELYQSLGIAPQDERPETVSMLCDVLDNEIDKLAEPADLQSAVKRLSDAGNLPSELYDVNIIPNVADNYGEWYERELPRIIETVHAPDSEQHFGPPTVPGEPYLISLFSREYLDKFPHRNFTMLVVGLRDGTRMIVHQAWRVYESQVNLSGVSSLLAMLEKFAQVYGQQIRVSGRQGKFIYSAELPIGVDPRSAITVEAKGPHKFTLSHFWQREAVTGKPLASLVVAIDLSKYRRLLQEMHAFD